MRTRTRLLSSFISPGGLCQFHNPESASGSNLTGDSPSIFDGETETIVDEPSKLVQGYKPVDHSVVSQWADTSSESRFHTVGNSTIRKVTGPNAFWKDWALTPPYLIGDDVFTTAYSISDERFVADTIEAFLSENQVDNLVNIVESPQLPESIQSLAKTLKKDSVRVALKRRVVVNGKHAKIISRRLLKGTTLAKATKTLSNAYLAYSFGLAPLLSDMRKCTSAVAKIRQDMKRAVAMQGKVVSTRRSMNGSFSLKHPEERNWVVGSGSFPGQLQMGGIAPHKICTITGVKSDVYNSKAFAGLDYMMKRFLSPGPASFIWEKIPYSFVVDWFANLKSVTQGLDNLLTGNTKKVYQAGISESYDISLSLVMKNNTSLSTQLSDSHNNATVVHNSCKRYRRYLMPAQNYVRTSGRFGKKQLSLAAALLYQKVAK